jgi:hypothetical protein
MADLLLTGAKLLATVRGTSFSRTVTYSRGSDSVSLSAGIGQTAFDAETSHGTVETYHSRDFLVTAADLILDGDTVTPERGDQITDTDPETSEVATYEVLCVGGKPQWRYSDPYQITLRIHTKKVG